MKRLYIRVISFFNTIQGKIAFYPTLLAILGFNFAFAMAALENSGVSKALMKYVPQLMLEDGDTALTIISVCIGGLISMMVFSFSMVMLLLSQASSNFSPRLLPGLISDKKNQVILGTYLASILYLIFTMFAIEPDDTKYALPGLSILLGIMLTIVCLGLFIYFIHNMSQSIQINNILDEIFDKSKQRLTEMIQQEAKIDRDRAETFPKTDQWFDYTTTQSGYLQNVSEKNMCNFCEQHDTRFHILIPKGLFVLNKLPLFRSEKELSEEQVNKILSNINFDRGEFVEDNYILAFKQITEIAVKAMSPGVNDPGTAINAIDYLTELFALRMKKQDDSILYKDNQPLVKMRAVSFKNLLYQSMASLRTYCKHDPVIVQKLIWMLTYLKDQENCGEKTYRKAVSKELKTLLKDAKRAISTKQDWKKIKKLVPKS